MQIPPRLGAKLAAFLRPRAAAVTCLIGFATLVAAAAQWHWFAELFSHFKPQLAVCALAMAALLYAIGAQRWGWLALALACWNGYPVAASLLAGGVSPPRIGREIAIAHANVNMNPDALAQLMQWLDSSQPGVDVVVLLEATPSFEPALHQLRSRFPHQIAELRDSLVALFHQTARNGRTARCTNRTRHAEYLAGGSRCSDDRNCDRPYAGITTRSRYRTYYRARDRLGPFACCD